MRVLLYVLGKCVCSLSLKCLIKWCFSPTCYLQFDYNPQFADWSRETRVAPLIHAKPLDNWLLIYTRRNYDAANMLLQNLFKVTPSMGIRMNKATM